MPGALIAMASNPAERVLSWGEVDWIIETSVAKMLAERFLPDRIVPVGGGGLIPAAIMAYRFYKKTQHPIIIEEPVYAKSYTHDHKQHDLSLLWPVGLERFDASDTLFVDDIVDTGATLDAIRQRMTHSRFYALVTKISGPNYWGTRDTKNQWWIFPWEKDPPQAVTMEGVSNG